MSLLPNSRLSRVLLAILAVVVAVVVVLIGGDAMPAQAETA